MLIEIGSLKMPRPLPSTSNEATSPSERIATLSARHPRLFASEVASDDEAASASAADMKVAEIRRFLFEHVDVTKAAEMPRAEFEAELGQLVNELLVEAKVQLNSAEQQEIVNSLLMDILGRGERRRKRRTSRDDRVELRASREEKRLLVTAAAYELLDVTSFIMRAALPAAQEVLAHHERIVLSERDTVRALELLENPPRPTAELLAAVRNYRQQTGE